MSKARFLANVVTSTGAISSDVLSTVVDGAPSALNTLNEIAAAINDDPNYATTLTTALSGKVPTSTTLTINGVGHSLAASRTWTIDSLPSQSTHSGKYLTTDGTTATWATVDALPSQSTHSGKYLTTNGTTASWAAVSVTPTAVSDQANSSTGYFDLPAGTTAQRPETPSSGMIRYNTSFGYVEQYTVDGWQIIAPQPTISTVSPSTYNGEQGTSFTITGSNYDSTATVKFITAQNVEYTAATVSRTNSSQLIATTPQDFTVANEPLKVKVINGSGVSYTLDNAIDCGGVPTWNTSSGTIATINDEYGSYSPIVSISAGDPDAGATVSYSITSGALPGNVSLNSSTGAISGDPTNVDSQTTYNFTAAATDNAGNQTTRSFSIIVNPSLDGSSSSRAASSAQAIKSLTGTTTSGVYWLSLPIVGTVQVYCDMLTDGGGWMMFAYAGSTSGVGNSNHMVFNTIGSLASTRVYGQTSFSRFDIARAITGASSSSQLMWRRTSESDKILIHSADEMWNRMPGGSSAGNRNMNGSGSGYPITTMKMSRTGVDGIVTKTNGRYENGPNYPGIAWNSSYNDNVDNVGSFNTYLNRRQIVYWETDGPEAISQWFHGRVLSLGDGSGPYDGTSRKDVEIYFKI